MSIQTSNQQHCLIYALPKQLLITYWSKILLNFTQTIFMSYRKLILKKRATKIIFSRCILLSIKQKRSNSNINEFEKPTWYETTINVKVKPENGAFCRCKRSKSKQRRTRSTRTSGTATAARDTTRPLRHRNRRRSAPFPCRKSYASLPATVISVLNCSVPLSSSSSLRCVGLCTCTSILPCAFLYAGALHTSQTWPLCASNQSKP